MGTVELEMKQWTHSLGMMPPAASSSSGGRVAPGGSVAPGGRVVSSDMPISNKKENVLLNERGQESRAKRTNELAWRWIWIVPRRHIESRTGCAKHE